MILVLPNKLLLSDVSVTPAMYAHQTMTLTVPEMTRKENKGKTLNL